jgi:hypothetical protein
MGEIAVLPCEKQKSKLVASDLCSQVVMGSGHWLME